jgi:hypothetical protein
MSSDLKKQLSDSTTHYNSVVVLEGLSLYGGLNLLSDINGFQAHSAKVAATLANFILKTSDATKTPKSPSSPSVRACFWDTYRFQYQGRTVVNIRNFNIGLLTGTVPYDRDSIQVTIKNFNVSHFDSKIDLLLSNFCLKRLIYSNSSGIDHFETPISMATLMRIPLIEVSLILNWNASNDYLFFLNNRKKQVEELQGFLAKELFVEVKCHLPKVETESSSKQNSRSVEDLMTKSSVPILLYEANVYNELINLPQLRHEYLLLHGIKPSNYNEEGTEADKAINQQKVAVCSNYMELVTYTLNQALNTKEENLIKFISQVSLSLHTTSIRMIAANKNLAFPIHKNINDRLDQNKDDCIVVGLQSIIESITYSSLFVKRPLKIHRMSTFEHHREDIVSDSSKLIWIAENGRGQLECFLAGFLYRTYKLIKFDEVALLNYKRHMWSTSMENPDHFATFFKLNKQQERRISADGSLELFDHDELYLEEENVTSPKSDQSAPFMSPNLLNKYRSELFSFSKAIRPIAQKIQGSPGIPDPVHILNFDHHEVFFSTRVILYELSKQRDLVDIHGRDLDQQDIIQASFEHFVTLFDSRICVVYSLFKVISELLEVQQDKNVNKLKIKSKKKKNSLGAHDKHVLKTEEEAKWNETEACKGSLKKRSLIVEKQNEISKEKVVHNTKVTYLFGVVIVKPQFNFNDYLNFNQTIFTSKEECFIYMQRECLYYDYFNMDPRITIRTIFKDLELFNGKIRMIKSTERKSRMKWIQSGLTRWSRSTG